MSGDYETSAYRVEDRIARITLDRPEKQNALSRELRDDIVAALHRAERDDDDGLLDRRERPAFCSGYDSDLLAANKMSLNQSYEIMGFRTALSTGPQWHALSSRLRPGGGEWGRISQEQGLRAAIEWRDGRSATSIRGRRGLHQTSGGD